MPFAFGGVWLASATPFIGTVAVWRDALRRVRSHNAATTERGPPICDATTRPPGLLISGRLAYSEPGEFPCFRVDVRICVPVGRDGGGLFRGDQRQRCGRRHRRATL